MYDDAILPYRSGKEYIRPCMMSHAPVDLLIVMLGTNDTKALFGSNEYTFMTGMEEFIKIIKDPALWVGNEAGKILLVAPPPLGDAIETSPYYGMFNEKSVELSKKFADLYERVANIYKCYFLNAALYAHSDPGDSIHFSVKDLA